MREPNWRDGAVLLLAVDFALCDDLNPENALAHARRIEAGLDEEPWAGGKHRGDCTKTPSTCIRCQVEEAEAEARKLYYGGDNPPPTDCGEKQPKEGSA